MTPTLGFEFSKDERLRELVAACCDGRATAEEWRELNEVILEDKGNAGFYIASIAQHSELRALMADHGIDCRKLLSAGSIESMLGQTESHVRQRVHGTGVQRRRLIWLSAVLSCAVAVMATQVLWFGTLKREVASLVELDGSGQARSLRPGDRITREAGECLISFYNGVKVAFDGRVDLEILSEMKVLLRSGQVKADVGEFGRGFKIQTGSAQVIDLGTVFGVEANAQNSTDVIVFDGLVDVDRLSANEETTHLLDRSLTTGEAIRVHSNGDLARIPTLWKDGQHWKWSTENVPGRSSLIASVKDNLSTDSRPKCYAVIAGGFQPGARSYVDRDYVWSPNGTFGFPMELMGGDYIQTFNDDKIQSDFELHLELSSAADVYVLSDARIEPPAWLQSDFVKVNRRIFQWADVNRFFGKNQNATTKDTSSVEYRFQLWKRRATAGETVRLGSASEDPAQMTNGLSMYGVVVVAPRNQTGD